VIFFIIFCLNDHCTIYMSTLSLHDALPIYKHEVDIFLDAAKDHIHYIAFYLAIFTGMRQGEILGLKWDSIDFDNKTLYVQRGLRSEEHTSELQSRFDIVCRLLLEKKKNVTG